MIRCDCFQEVCESVSLAESRCASTSSLSEALHEHTSVVGRQRLQQDVKQLSDAVSSFKSDVDAASTELSRTVTEFDELLDELSRFTHWLDATEVKVTAASQQKQQAPHESDACFQVEQTS